MLQMIDEAKGEIKPGSHDDDIEALKKASANLEWKLTGKAGIKKAVGDLLGVLQAHSNALDLPEDSKEARAKLGGLVQMHRDKTVEEIIPLVVEDLGFKKDKAAKAAKKEKAVENLCKNPKNASVVAAIQELSQLYFKEGAYIVRRQMPWCRFLCFFSNRSCPLPPGNANAGASYSKAAMALKDVEYEITAENAMKMSKGKTKVDCVGKVGAQAFAWRS